MLGKVLNGDGPLILHVDERLLFLLLLLVFPFLLLLPLWPSPWRLKGCLAQTGLPLRAVLPSLRQPAAAVDAEIDARAAAVVPAGGAVGCAVAEVETSMSTLRIFSEKTWGP